MIMKIKLKNVIFICHLFDIRIDIENTSFVLFVINFLRECYFMSVNHQKWDLFSYVN
jgi:hypothetical protein